MQENSSSLLTRRNLLVAAFSSFAAGTYARALQRERQFSMIVPRPPAPGEKNDTNALQRAIDLAHRGGGGTVYLPARTYVSGSPLLRSNVSLWLDTGAIRAVPDRCRRSSDPDPRECKLPEDQLIGAIIQTLATNADGAAFFITRLDAEPLPSIRIQMIRSLSSYRKAHPQEQHLLEQHLLADPDAGVPVEGVRDAAPASRRRSQQVARHAHRTRLLQTMTEAVR